MTFVSKQKQDYFTTTSSLAIIPTPNLLAISYGEEEEAFGGGGGAEEAAVTGLQNPRNRAGRSVTSPDIQQRADDTPHHRVQKAICFNLDREPIASTNQTNVADRAARIADEPAALVKRAHVVAAFQCHCLASHERDV